MKQISVPITTYREHFEATDGTQFDTKEECQKYESSAKCALLSRYKKLAVNRDTEYNLIGYGSDDSNVEICVVNSMDDVNIILQLVALYGSNITDEKRNSVIRAMENKELLLIYRGYNNDGFYVESTKEELIERIEKNIIPTRKK